MNNLNHTNRAFGPSGFGTEKNPWRNNPSGGTNYRQPAYGHRDPNDKQFASQVFGDIARKDWWDYQDTFMPVHGVFKDAVMSDSLTLEQLDKVPDLVNKSFDQSAAMVNARNSRMGLAAIDDDTSHSRGLAEVFAENQARTHGKERRNSAIVGANINSQTARVNQ